MDLIVDAHVQGSLAHLLEVAGGGLTEALHGQANVLLPYEESLHHTLGCIQQVCERDLERGWEKKDDSFSLSPDSM